MKTQETSIPLTVVKPFLKWAGGKSQLLKEIEHFYPFEEGCTKYAEPFVGGGAVLFDILNKFTLEDVFISDANPDLINTYACVKSSVEELLPLLSLYESEFLPLDKPQRKAYYMAKRQRFNTIKTLRPSHRLKMERAALFIFINKTCFNGLFRVNSKGLFNVPIGSNQHPLICDKENLLAVSERLQNVRIFCGDYRASASFIDDKTFVYFDPPYRPLEPQANFTAYTEQNFTDQDQLDLASYVRLLDKVGARFVVSNSDPKNTHPEDDFFERAYASFMIKRVEAIRIINSKGSDRGKINELLITNCKNHILC